MDRSMGAHRTMVDLHKATKLLSHETWGPSVGPKCTNMQSEKTPQGQGLVPKVGTPHKKTQHSTPSLESFFQFGCVMRPWKF
jgi:hypothetical protein